MSKSAGLTDNVRARALDHWKRGETLRAGARLFRSVRPDVRPIWAARILRLIVDRTNCTSPCIEHVIRLAQLPREWSEGHRAFDAVRDEVLKHDRKECEPNGALHSNLVLAELVAKVIYNATNPDDEFDTDSGWWIAPVVRDILDEVNDEGFAAAAWAMLVNDDAA